MYCQDAVHVRDNKKIILCPKIINLPSYSLSNNQKNILIKGLKYTPTSKRNIIELKRDVVEFTRKLRLIEMFSSKEKEIAKDFICQSKKIQKPTSIQKHMPGQNK